MACKKQERWKAGEKETFRSLLRENEILYTRGTTSENRDHVLEAMAKELNKSGMLCYVYRRVNMVIGMKRK